MSEKKNVAAKKMAKKVSVKGKSKRDPLMPVGKLPATIVKLDEQLRSKTIDAKDFIVDLNEFIQESKTLPKSMRHAIEMYLEHIEFYVTGKEVAARLLQKSLDKKGKKAKVVIMSEVGNLHYVATVQGEDNKRQAVWIKKDEKTGIHAHGIGNYEIGEL